MILTVLPGLFQGVGTMLTLCVYGIPKISAHRQHTLPQAKACQTYGQAGLGQPLSAYVPVLW